MELQIESETNAKTYKKWLKMILYSLYYYTTRIEDI